MNVVLVMPRMPGNTGNIGRTCLGYATRLHLVKPLGFKLDDAAVRRAGLDYWPDVDVTLHDSYAHFMKAEAPENLLFFTKFGKTELYDSSVVAPLLAPEKIYGVFGSETTGLHGIVNEKELAKGTHIKVPMLNDAIRSHNLACTVAMFLGEAYRVRKYC